MRGAALALLALFAAPSAQAQAVFSALTGTFGEEGTAESCAVNPETLSFDAERRRLRMSWAEPVASYMRDELITALEGDVVVWDGTSITYHRDGETRLDPKGAPILWTLTLQGAGFCITNTRGAGEACIAVYRLCNPPAS
jgi:hypothetical protein